MSVRDFSQDLHRSVRTLSLEKILQVLQSQQKQTPKIEDDDLIRFFMYAPLIDIHDTGISFETESLIVENYSAHFALPTYKKIIQPQVKTYPLIHDNSHAAGIIFNSPGKLEGTRSSGAAKTDGTSYQIISNHDTLNPIDKISIAMNLFIPSSIISGHIIHKGDSYSLSIINDKLRWQIHNGAPINLDITIPKNEWFTLIVSYDSTFGLRGKVNDSNVHTLLAIGALSVFLTDLGIFGKADGTSLAPAGVLISWLCMIHGEVITIDDWVSDYHSKKILNLASPNIEEITTIPYMASLDPQPNAAIGLFYVR